MIELVIYVLAQLLLEPAKNIAVVMEHVKQPARSIPALVLNVSVIRVGPGINAKIVRK